MQQQLDLTRPADELACEALEARFVERTRRVSLLIALDRALSDAANRHNLAAQIVHHGWPHRAD